MRFAAAIKGAAERAPMGNAAVPIVQSRVVNIDGDGLAYYCAGNDDTDPGTARQTLIDKIDSAIRAASAERARLLVTGQASHKGHRYAIARAKPYQGGRANKSKPKNWAYLRSVLEGGTLPHETIITDTQEADDLFHQLRDDNTVTMSHDKDMRMLPGWHMSWVEHIMINVADEFSVIYGEKQYGHGWFWQQMLMGDSVDNIPGLPGMNYTNAKGEAKVKKIGEVTASEMLAGVTSDETALLVCLPAYSNLYGKDRATVELLEQGCLLWMRRTDDPFDVLLPGGPLHLLNKRHDIAAARAEIQGRIDQVLSYVNQAQDDAGSGDAPVPVVEAEQPVCAVPTPVGGGRCGVGSRPHDGVHSSDTAPGLQQPAREGGEQLEAVRREEPFRIPSWVRPLLAGARHTTN